MTASQHLVTGLPALEKTALAWSDADRLGFCSWDGHLGVLMAPDFRPILQIHLPDALMSCCWLGPQVMACGGGSGQIYLIHTCGSLRVQMLKAHDGPVVGLAFDLHQRLVSISWDSWIKKWDLTPYLEGEMTNWYAENTLPVTTTEVLEIMTAEELPVAEPATAYQLATRPLCMDVRGQICVVGLAPKGLVGGGLVANSYVAAFFLEEPNKLVLLRTLSSPLKYQTRAVALFADQKGFYLSSIEGRCAIIHLEPGATGDFIFKCHRDPDAKLIYQVEALTVHPKYDTFATAGGDGSLNYWDRATRTRLKTILKPEAAPRPITAAVFSPTQRYIALARGDDFSDPAVRSPTQIWIQEVGLLELQAKPKAATKGK